MGETRHEIFGIRQDGDHLAGRAITFGGSTHAGETRHSQIILTAGMISISEATGSPRGSPLTAGSGWNRIPEAIRSQIADLALAVLHGRARILCLRGLGLSAAESARSYHQPGLHRHQSGRGVQGQDHGAQAFPLGDELRRLPGEDEVAADLITPTPDRLCRGRAIEDAVLLTVSNWLA
jgi:hypothetical protein